MFNAAVEALREDMQAQGRILVLRDHAHSQFCTRLDSDARATLRDILTEGGQAVLSVLSVRHPLDSFLSLDSNEWRTFAPFTLEGYAERYQSFLGRYTNLRIFRYEDFIADPDATLSEMCAALDLPFLPGAESLLKVVKMSGDSGRSSARITARPRRPVPDGIAKQAKCSPAYHRLCETLGYPADHG